MYRELITGLTSDATFFESATQIAINAAAESLGTPLPTSLANALLESNGIHGEYELGLLWPLQRIVADNLAFCFASIVILIVDNQLLAAFP